MTSETITLQTPRCFHCGETGTVQVLAGDLERYRSGALIQRAFPELPAPLREQIISGTHPACWDAMYAGLEDEEDAE